MAVQVERLGLGDAARLRELRLTALQSDPDAFYRTYAEEVDQPAEFWSGWLARPRTVLLVAVDEGRDVGIGGLVPDRHVPEELAVITFWVDPSARGRGVARALLDALVRSARDDGAPALTLEVADANEAAVNLYAAAGFEPTGHTGAFAAAARARHRARAPARPAPARLSQNPGIAPCTRNSDTEVASDDAGGDAPAPAAAGRTARRHHAHAEHAEDDQDAVGVEVERRERRRHAEQPEVHEELVQNRPATTWASADGGQDLPRQRTRARLGAHGRQRESRLGGGAPDGDDGGALGEDRGHALTVAAGRRPRPRFRRVRVPVPTPSGPTALRA